MRAQLRALLRAREHVLHLRRLEQNHREHLAAAPLLQPQSEQRLAACDAQLAALERAARALVAGCTLAREQPARLAQVQGGGEITAWTVWADLPEAGTLAPGQAAALAGLAPHPRDSGQHHGHRHIGHGRATLRRVLYLAALTASRHHPVLRPHYQRLLARGKPVKVALVALARRLIELLNRLLLDPTFRLAT